MDNVIVFRDVRGFESQYSVTNDCRVWSKERKIYMKQWVDKNGYHHVSLWDKMKKRYRDKRIGRIVFEAFYRRLLPNEVVHHLSHKCDQDIPINLVAWDKKRHRDYHRDSEKTRKKKSIKQKGKKLSEEHKRKKSQSMKKFYLQHPEAKEKHSKDLKKNWERRNKKFLTVGSCKSC